MNIACELTDKKNFVLIRELGLNDDEVGCVIIWKGDLDKLIKNLQAAKAEIENIGKEKKNGG